MFRPNPVEGWELWLPPPDRKRPWINLNDRNHWGKKSPLTKYWREAAYRVAFDSDLAKYDREHNPGCEFVWTYPHVTAYLAFGDNRRRDVHNYMPTVKAIIDGCTDARLWVDDRDGVLTGPDMRRDESRAVGVTLRIREFVGEKDGNH